jgi:glycyl-tRNA synthetase beta chain
VSRTLLFEIGVEELPSTYVPPALDQLAENAERLLAESNLVHGELQVHGTPRRLALLVREVADRQADREEEVVGPAARAAFDEDGKPSKALIGFCRGKGVNPDDVRRIQTPRGEYVAVTVFHAGRQAEDVLPEMLATLATRIQFPKTMRWGADDSRFARPVRWLVALLGDEVLPVHAFGVEADRRSYGHRFLAPAPVKIRDADAYLDTLDGASVAADHRERARRLVRQIEALAREAGGRVVADDELVTINNFLVEWPTCFAGRFDAHYLDLPREVVIESLREHQRFFAVESDAQALLPVFLAVRNGDERGIDTVRKGNEDVLIARLEDARFYWETDLEHPPATRVGDLTTVVWMEGLGSLRDKASRLVALSGWIAERVAPAAGDAAQRAALLCKTDLLSEMIGSGKEYASLEGVIGGYYALKAGEPRQVAAAITEHYRPRGPADALPASEAGDVLSLADKLDHIAGAFVAGKIPSGSEDPYGVRRAANGVLRILVEHDRNLDLRHATEEATKPFFTADRDLPHAEIVRKLGDFWRGRVEAALEERGVPYDVRGAALDARIRMGGHDRPGWIDPADCVARGLALAEFRGDARFEPLVVLFKRVANILTAATETLPETLDEAKLSEKAERALLAALSHAQRRTEPLWERSAYAKILPELLAMESPIHTFFDDVMVNVDDLAVRGNRLRLLADVRALFVRGWDLSQVVLSGERNAGGERDAELSTARS